MSETSTPTMSFASALEVLLQLVEYVVPAITEDPAAQLPDPEKLAMAYHEAKAAMLSAQHVELHHIREAALVALLSAGGYPVFMFDREMLLDYLAKKMKVDEVKIDEGRFETAMNLWLDAIDPDIEDKLLEGFRLVMETNDVVVGAKMLPQYLVGKKYKMKSMQMVVDFVYDRHDQTLIGVMTQEDMDPSNVMLWDLLADEIENLSPYDPKHALGELSFSDCIPDDFS